MTTIKHIVFDIGQVLIHYDPNIVYRKLIPDDEKRAWFFQNVCTHEWNLEQDRGRAWSEGEDLLIKTHPDWEHEIRAFRVHWAQMVPNAYEESVEIFKRVIGNGHDVTLLTNFAADTFSQAQRRFDFLNLARGVTVSGEVKEIKPERAIFDLHAKNFNLDTSATFFIDDNKANIEMAQKLGWIAHHFTTPKRLENDLKALDITY